MNIKIILSTVLIVIINAIGYSEVVTVPLLDVEKTYPYKVLNIKEEVGAIEFIPLETNEKSIIKNIDALAVNDSYIIVTDFGTNQILVFNREGKFISMISHKGGGPEEYLLIRASCIDFDNQEVFICDSPTRSQIKVYGFNGKYKRTLRMGEKCSPDEMANYNGDYLMIYAANNPKRYLLVNKTDGKISHFTKVGDVAENVSNKVVTERGATMISVNRIAKSGDKVVISDFSTSPIYTAVGTKLMPLLSRKNIVSGDNKNIVTVTNIINNRYIISVIPLTIDPQTKKQDVDYSGIYSICYDSKTREITKIKDIDTQISDLYNMDLPENMNVEIYPIDLLLMLKQKGEMPTELSKIFSTLDMNSNPILKITNFKNR